MQEQSNTPAGSQGGIWQLAQFRAYPGSTAFSGMAFAMQQLLLSWILIGILNLPADQVGVIQAVIGIPGIFLMLMGGASADRADPRRMLMWAYVIAPVFPLFLIAMEQIEAFAVWSVVVWGVGIAVAQSYSLPAQQAILSRVSGDFVQQGVTLATMATFVVQVIGLLLAGQIDGIGVAPILAAQALTLFCAAFTITRIHSDAARAPDAPPLSGNRSAHSTLQGIAEGLRATYADKIISNTLLITFVSSIFNAGSFMTVFPFIVKRIYDGEAFELSALMALFFVGAAISNALLLRFMPLRRPGRLFLVMQLSRIVVLAMLYVQGSWWLLILATFGWGLNMGITTNLARMIVQESAVPEFRGRILSVFSVGMIGSGPVGALILGWLIENVGVLQALLPAMLVSAVLFSYGWLATGVWRYESAVPDPSVKNA